MLEWFLTFFSSNQAVCRINRAVKIRFFPSAVEPVQPGNPTPEISAQNLESSYLCARLSAVETNTEREIEKREIEK